MGQFTFEETNLICCYRRKTRADTAAAMTAALPYMETEIQELAGRTIEKLKQLTEEEFAGLVFLPAEDME
ncbi:MAG: transposon-transfer assisting family protein [Ruminococcus sp.]|nr:transposon-transfer assisting family protein [Ruminococcus sp.]MCM1488381.1 transposon-transfer assisting family protein [Bacillota bacterium]